MASVDITIYPSMVPGVLIRLSGRAWWSLECRKIELLIHGSPTLGAELRSLLIFPASALMALYDTDPGKVLSLVVTRIAGACIISVFVVLEPTTSLWNR